MFLFVYCVAIKMKDVYYYYYLFVLCTSWRGSLSFGEQINSSIWYFLVFKYYSKKELFILSHNYYYIFRYYYLSVFALTFKCLYYYLGGYV